MRLPAHKPAHETKFKRQYATHLKHLRLQGLRPKTIDAYARPVRCIGAYFHYAIDDLSESQLTDYLHEVVETQSASTAKHRLYGLQFYYQHVLHKPLPAAKLVKIRKVQRLPDVVTVEEAARLFAATRVISYRVLYFTLYSLGLRLGEGLRLEVGDIDAARARVHVRDAKGRKDRFVPLPAAAIDRKRRLWRTRATRGKKPYLFAHKALAKVFRAKMLDTLAHAKLSLPVGCPERWVVDCKAVGAGDKALLYLGRYLYRGVIAENNILACQDGQVTFRYQDSKTKRWQTRTLPGAEFLWKILHHILPRRFRRARNFGFLHPNSKRLIQLVQLLCKVDLGAAKAIFKTRPALTCRHCGGAMKVTHIRLPPARKYRERPPDGLPECVVM